MLNPGPPPLKMRATAPAVAKTAIRRPMAAPAVSPLQPSASSSVSCLSEKKPRAVNALLPETPSDTSVTTRGAPDSDSVSPGTVCSIPTLTPEERQLLLSSPAVLVSQQTPSHLSRVEIADFFSRFGPLQGQEGGGGGGLQFPNDRRDKRVLILFSRLSDAAKCLRSLQRDTTTPGNASGEDGFRGTPAVGGEGVRAIFADEFKSFPGGGQGRGGSGGLARWPHPVQLSREDKIKVSALKGNPRALHLLHTEGVLARLRKEKREHALRAAAAEAEAGRKKVGLFDEEEARANERDTRKQSLATKSCGGASPSPSTLSQGASCRPLNGADQKGMSASRGDGAARLGQPACVRGGPETSLMGGLDRCRVPPQASVQAESCGGEINRPLSLTAPAVTLASKTRVAASPGAHRPFAVGGASGVSSAGNSADDNSFLDLLSGALVAERLEEENAELLGSCFGDGAQRGGATQDSLEARTRRETESALLR